MSGGAFNGKLARPLAKHGLYVELDNLFEADPRELALAFITSPSIKASYGKCPMGNEAFIATDHPHEVIRLANSAGYDARKCGRLAMAVAKELRPEYVVEVVGAVNKRPDKNVNPDVQNGDIELGITAIKILAKADSLPFDMSVEGYNLDLPTELDHRALTLRHPRLQAIFRVQAVIIDSFREFMKSQEFFEFQAPAITPATAEGGAEVFQVNYFDKKAYLTSHLNCTNRCDDCI